jgi:hypothetical protein
MKLGVDNKITEIFTWLVNINSTYLNW